MSTIVAFDQKGALGPAMTLIFNGKYLNRQGVEDVANLLKVNFMNLSQMKPKGKKAFIRVMLEKTLSPNDIIATPFFWSMQCRTDTEYHKAIVEKMIPAVHKVAKESLNLPEMPGKEVQEWTARMFECYIKPEQLNQFFNTPTPDEKVYNERKSIGMDLYTLANNKQITEKDVDLTFQTIAECFERLKKADHLNEALKLTGRYLVLCSMDDKDPLAVFKGVETMMPIFKQKLFAK